MMCMILTLLMGEYKIIMSLIFNKNHPFNLQEDYFSCTVIFKKVLDKENYVILFTPKPRHRKIKKKGAPLSNHLLFGQDVFAWSCPSFVIVTFKSGWNSVVCLLKLNFFHGIPHVHVVHVLKKIFTVFRILQKYVNIFHFWVLLLCMKGASPCFQKGLPVMEKRLSLDTNWGEVHHR